MQSPNLPWYALQTLTCKINLLFPSLPNRGKRFVKRQTPLLSRPIESSSRFFSRQKHTLFMQSLWNSVFRFYFHKYAVIFLFKSFNCFYFHPWISWAANPPWWRSGLSRHVSNSSRYRRLGLWLESRLGHERLYGTVTVIINL